MVTEGELRRLCGLAWAVSEFGEEDLEPGVVSELADGLLILIEGEQVAPGADPAQADPSNPGGGAATGTARARPLDRDCGSACLRGPDAAEPAPRRTHGRPSAPAIRPRPTALGGTGEASPYPVHRHDASEHPADALHAVLHEFGCATLPDRAKTLAHGLNAVRTLQSQVAEARAWARGFEHGYLANVDTDTPPEWLTAPSPR